MLLSGGTLAQNVTAPAGPTHKHQSTERVSTRHYRPPPAGQTPTGQSPPGMLSGGRGLTTTTAESDTMRHDGRREAEKKQSTFLTFGKNKISQNKRDCDVIKKKHTFIL